MPQLHFRSIWISDLHLGSKNLQTEQLLDFLSQTESEFLYLVGDIIDLLQAQKKWHWPVINDRIVHAVFEKAKNGTKVMYIPGNHDHALRKLNGSVINNIHLMNSVVHETIDGHRYLVMHGDAFDPVIRSSPRLASFGSSAYDLVRGLGRVFNKGKQGKENRSLSAWLKNQVKIAVNFLGNFEHSVMQEAAEHGVEGLICGHIHRAGIREIEHILYTNTGDWVESCTALAENHAGRLGIVEWRNQPPQPEAIAAKTYENMYSNRCLASSN